MALTAASATGGTVLSAASIGGAPALPVVTAASVESAAEPAISGTVPSAASVKEGQSGNASRPLERCHRTRQRRWHRQQGGTAAPVESAVGTARKLASAAGSAGNRWVANICGERGASTHPFDPGTVFQLEVRYSSDEHGSNSKRSSSNDDTNDCDSWWDATCVGALLRPFDPGKQCRRRKSGSRCGSPF